MTDQAPETVNPAFVPVADETPAPKKTKKAKPKAEAAPPAEAAEEPAFVPMGEPSFAPLETSMDAFSGSVSEAAEAAEDLGAGLGEVITEMANVASELTGVAVDDLEASVSVTPSAAYDDDWMSTPAPMGHNNPVDLDEIAKKVASITKRLEIETVTSRSRWLQVGELLLQARNAKFSTVEFGQWVKASGVSKLPGLTTASARSDVIWCAEFPKRVSSIPEDEANHPRTIRATWRRTFAAACRNEAETLISLEATEIPDIEAAADAVALKYGGDSAEAFGAIQSMIEAEVSGEAAQEALEKAHEKLQKAMQEACNAGLQVDSVCISVGTIWGGVVTWAPGQSVNALGD